jgi:hypothetical protein
MKARCCITLIANLLSIPCLYTPEVLGILMGLNEQGYSQEGSRHSTPRSAQPAQGEVPFLPQRSAITYQTNVGVVWRAGEDGVDWGRLRVLTDLQGETSTSSVTLGIFL